MADRPTLAAQLRALSRHEHDDLSIAADAADLIEELAGRLEALIAASGHMSPFGGDVSVKGVRLAGKYMAAVEAAHAALRLAKGE